MSQRDSRFVILASNKAAALEALKGTAGDEERMNGGSWGGGNKIERWYSWVNMTYAEATTLEGAIGCWRWQATLDDNGDIVELLFDGEKFGDDEVLLGAIAPYVEEGSYVEMQGEEGEIWRWYFDGLECVEITPTVVWPDAPSGKKGGKENESGAGAEKGRIYKHTFGVEVLNDVENYDPDSLSNLDYDIMQGDMSGAWERQSVELLEGQDAVDAILAQGSDPEFFGMDDDGNRIDYWAKLDGKWDLRKKVD